MFSPIRLRNMAKESGSCCFRGQFQVAPDGTMYLGNRTCTLSEAVRYAAKLARQEIDL
jgi:hypothetical protein